MAQQLDFYAAQGRISDPGSYGYLFDDLPASAPELARVAQNLTLHLFWAKRYGQDLAPERQGEVQLRTLQKRLARALALDERPLAEPRALDKKTVGICRDFSLLLAAMLRHKGIPARARCGFGAYFKPGYYEDHWVAEYWNAVEGRWTLVDAQLDEFQCQALKVPFNPLDVPRDQFIVGGLAWQMCRTGQESPEKFGIFDMRGLMFVRGNLIRDVAALNKVELLPWDCWGLINGDDSLLSPDDWVLLDRLAELTRGDVPDFDTLRGLYEADPRLGVGSEIGSWVNGKMEIIQLND